ncbi:MAG: cytochrome c [Proteobacteria bacterium]|jgi:mono/diheme cytochrome c family protein|nr:cytochrome c [Pseudomonadota bacterium]
MSRRITTIVTVALLLAGIAHGFPWNVDMADSQAIKAYEQPMAGLPKGVVAQPNILTPMGFIPHFERHTNEAQALTAGFAPNQRVLEMGRQMYDIYCASCHGDGIVAGPVAAPGRFPGVVPIAGQDSLTNTRTNGYLFFTIRNGGPLMPDFGWAMTDREMWSLVHFLRTMPNNQPTEPSP